MIEYIGYISIGFFWLTGFVVWFYVFKPMNAQEKKANEFGFDTSNRINRLRLLWLMLRKPWLFVVMFQFLTMDEYEQAEYLNKIRKGE